MPITIRVTYGDRKDDKLTVEITDVTMSAVQIKEAALAKGLTLHQAMDIIEQVEKSDYEVVM